ncbi:MAG: alpha/beta hydrolase [Brumimicrobium sp.]
MKTAKQLFILLIISLIVHTSCKKDDTNEDEEESTYKNSQAYTLEDIPYGLDERQIMDIYLPSNRNATSTKVFVLIHGGGWSSGSKNSFSSTLDNLKTTYPDYAVINLNYRLGTPNDPGYPKQIEDIQRAITEIQKNKYNVSNQYCFYGISAGAHLSMLYSYAFDPNNEVKGVCNVVGPSDFTDTAYYNTFTESAITPALVGTETIAENPQLYEEVSPAKQITTNSSPTISFYGGQDTLVPPSQLDLLHDELNDKGIYNQATLYPNKTHSSWTESEINDFVEKFAQFVEDHF